MNARNQQRHRIPYRSLASLGLALLSATIFLLAKGQASGAERSSPQGEALPPGAVARLGTSLFWQGDRFLAFAVSADGKHLATAGTSSRDSEKTHIGLWELPNGKKSREIAVAQGLVNCLCFAPDGRTLAAGCGPVVVLWDVSSGKEIKRYDLHEKTISFVRFSADGQTVFSGDGSATVHQWDRAMGRRLEEWKPWPDEQPRLKNGMKAEECDTVLVSPTGKSVVWQVCGYKASEASGTAVGDRYFLRIRALDGKGGVRELSGPPAAFGRLAFAPNGQLVATGFGGIWLWDLSGKRRVRTLGKDCADVAGMTFSADGQTLASCHTDDTVRLWEVSSGRLLRRFACPKQERGDRTPRPLAFSGDGGILIVGGSRGMMLWDVKAGQEVRPSGGHREAIQRLAFTPDGRSLTTRGEVTCCRWDTATWKETKRIDQWRSTVADEETLAISTDAERMLTRSAEGAIHLRESATHKALHQWDVGRVGFGEGVFAPDGRSAVVGERKGTTYTGIVLDLAAGKERARLMLRPFVAGPIYAPDSSLLAWLAEDQTIHLVNAVTGAEVRQLGKRMVPLWKRDDKEQLFFSPQGDYLAVRCPDPPNIVSVWDVDRGTVLGKVDAVRGQGTLTTAALSPDGRTLATSRDDENFVRLWEVASGQEYRRCHGHVDTVLALTFSADGATLVSGSRDHTALVWDAQIPRTARKKEYTAAELSSLWGELRGDARRAVEVVRLFGDIPKQSIPFLKERLSPVEKVSKQRIQQMILDLDSDEFAIREKATQELARLAEHVEPDLRKTLTERPTLELRHRILGLLHRLAKNERDRKAEQLRNLRAVASLEYAATEEARALLLSLSRGGGDAPLTREAKSALRRLAKRR